MDHIRKKAILEIAEEKFRAAVEAEKERLRWPWWKKLFPWRVRITVYRIDKGTPWD
jgi:hypothetical protein